MESWHQLYYGLSKEEVDKHKRDNSGIYGSGGNPLKVLDQTFQGLSTAGLGLMDFGMDFVGNLPGMAGVDNAWDKHTELDNPIHQRIRNMMSIILPSLYGGQLVQGKVMATQAVKTCLNYKGCL